MQHLKNYIVIKSVKQNIMKTIFRKAFVALIVILLFSINLNANNNSVDYRRIQNRVSSFINYPKIDKEKNEVAVVLVDI